MLGGPLSFGAHMKILVSREFSYWHRGVERRDYVPSAEPVETDEECAAVAVQEGWASLPDEVTATRHAPENKDAAPKRRTKTTE